jgi:hypothetical protein
VLDNSRSHFNRHTIKDKALATTLLGLSGRKFTSLGKCVLCAMARLPARPSLGLVFVLVLSIPWGACSQGLPRDTASVLSASSAAQTLAKALQRAEQWRQEVNLGFFLRFSADGWSLSVH